MKNGNKVNITKLKVLHRHLIKLTSGEKTDLEILFASYSATSKETTFRFYSSSIKFKSFNNFTPRFKSIRVCEDFLEENIKDYKRRYKEDED